PAQGRAVGAAVDDAQRPLARLLARHRARLRSPGVARQRDLPAAGPVGRRRGHGPRLHGVRRDRSAAARRGRGRRAGPDLRRAGRHPARRPDGARRRRWSRGPMRHADGGAPGDALEARLDLAYGALRLKDVERTGWALRGVAAPESVADHCYGTALLCHLYAADPGVDRDPALAVAPAHGPAEAATADAADRDVSEDEKAAAERAAMAELVPPAAEEVRALWREYEERATPEAVFVRDMNLLDMCLQALYYEASSRYDASRPVPSSAGY